MRASDMQGRCCSGWPGLRAAAAAFGFKSAAIVVLCLFLGSVQAQTSNTREQEQLRRLRQQLQQLQAEQSQAQQQAQRATAESNKLTEQLKAAQAESARSRAIVAQRSREGAALEAERAAWATEKNSLQAELGRLKQTQDDSSLRLQRTSTELTETRVRLTTSETAGAGLRRERSLVGELLDKCSANNTELLRVGHELLGRYGNFGIGETLAAREPFLQFKRVQLENLAQDYRSRIDGQRFTAPDGVVREASR